MKKGLEIERRFLMIEPTILGENTMRLNLKMYDLVLQKGTKVMQGYIMGDHQNTLKLMGFNCDFDIDTFRLRKYGNKYFLTLKDKGQKKSHVKKEQEHEITRLIFNSFWPLTKGHRIFKKRLCKQYVDGKRIWDVEYDAFTDRFLMIAEVEAHSLEEYKKVPPLGLDVSNITKWSNKNLSK